MKRRGEGRLSLVAEEDYKDHWELKRKENILRKTNSGTGSTS